MKTKIVILIALLIFTSCNTKESNIEILSVTELQLVLKEKKGQLIDVRTAREFKLGHITNAELIDVKSSKFEEEIIEKLDKNKPVYVYCKSGKRGKKACAILKERGFKVYNLEGGYLKWKSKNKQ